MGCGSVLLSPESYGPSTIGAEKLNCCVRDGNRCGLLANTTTDHWLDTSGDARGRHCEGVDCSNARVRGVKRV